MNQCHRATLALLFTGQLVIAHNNFHEQWITMQQEYTNLCATLPATIENKYIHPLWMQFKHDIKQLIMGQPQENFLHTCDAIRGSMLRRKEHIPQRYELRYLQQCIKKETRELIASYQDTTFGGTTVDYTEFNCSSNTLGGLFYASKVIEKTEKDIKTIIEFGAGYGNQARIFKTLLPELTLFLIDLPELLVLQKLFLSQTMPQTKVLLHHALPQHFEKEAIHLIPAVLLPELSITADLFFSTFALSEASVETQKIITNKCFFNADHCYLVGQMSRWKNFAFESHEHVINKTRDIYKIVEMQPYHWMLNNLDSYELYAHTIMTP